MVCDFCTQQHSGQPAESAVVRQTSQLCTEELLRDLCAKTD